MPEKDAGCLKLWIYMLKWISWAPPDMLYTDISHSYVNFNQI